MSTGALTPPFNGAVAPQPPQQSTGPACDECRQKKVKCDRTQPVCGHCSRNGLSCGFSGRGKRVNHARKLVDDVAGLNDRLDSIDDVTQQLMERMDAVTELLQESRISVGLHDQARSLRAANQEDDPETNPPSHTLRATVSKPDNIAAEAPNLVQSESGLERFYGSFSTHALFHTARKIVEALIVQVQSSQSNPALLKNSPSSSPNILKLSQILDHTALPQIIQSFNTWSSQPYDEDDLALHTQFVALPPIRLLEESLRCFSDNFSTEWPIFRRATVLGAIQTQYTTRQQTPDIAWSLCFNNIILLCLNSRSDATSSNISMRALAENGMLASLVNNAKLAINMTPYLMSPRLVNVQALLSLALVARDFIHYSIFERALFYAYQVASMMGLQEDYGRELASEAENSERRDLLWTIYSLDKQRCFLRGAPCLIYHFECSVSFPSHQDSLSEGYWLAQIRLACVMEDTYRTLYSPRSKKQTNQQLEEHLKNCDKQLRNWGSRHGSLLSTTPGTWSTQTLFAQQLRYSHLSCLILVHRRGPFVENQNICLESAREALKIIQVLTTGANVYKQALFCLRRIFNSCSMMAYYELWVHVLYSPCRGYTGDVALLLDFSKALNLLAMPGYPEAYCARVSRAIKWCTEMVQLIQDIKLPGGTVSPNMQFPAYSTAAQLGAWELLAPAFFSTSPYDYGSVDSGMDGTGDHSLANVEVSLQAARAYMTQSQEQVWDQQSDMALDTNQPARLSLSHLDESFASAGVPFQTDMETNMPTASDMSGTQDYS